ncbi:NB-ARC domain-containing protein [Nocardia sp. NPDC057353]|uniref:NB-ARC domain-containing protein n=1 Tax=Nocardia sp. NPDC057353 TaxID=3346104 RepID=UPI00362671CA
MNRAASADGRDMAAFVAELQAAVVRAEKRHRVSRVAIAKRLSVSPGSVYAYLNGTTLPGTEIFDRLLAELHIGAADAKRLVDLRDTVDIARRGGRARADAPPDDPPPPADLPRDIPVLHGRAAELERIAAIVGAGTGGVCVLSGLGGVGKTALAVRTARALLPRFADGCLFTDLHGYAADPATAPEVAAGTLLRQLAVAPELIPAHPDARLALLREHLNRGRFLVVLDNALDAAQVTPLLPGGGASMVLITSRSTLNGLDDVDRVQVGRLPEHEAAALLTRLTAALPADRLPDGEGRAALVRQCHGLPVAIRIVSAILRSEGWPTAPSGGYEVDLTVLHDGDRSVEALFEHSVTRLPAEPAATFTLLGLHPGPDFEVHSAAALVGVDRAAMQRHLRILVEVNLLESPAAGRYRLHDLLRDFAGQRAASECDAAATAVAATRIVDHYTAFADAADRVLTPHRHRSGMAPRSAHPATAPRSYSEAIRAMTAERDHLAATAQLAFDTGLDEQCWQLAFAVRGFAFVTGDIELWTRTHELALAAAVRAGNRAAAAVTRNNLGLALITAGRDGEAEQLYEQAQAQFAELGDRHGEHTAIAHRAWIHVHRGELAEALRLSRRALDFVTEHGAPRNRAILLRDTALIEVKLGRHYEAVPKLLEALEMFRAFTLYVDEAMACNVLGDAYLALSALDDAADAFQRGTVLGRMGGSIAEQARGHDGFGRVAAAQHNPETALESWRTAHEFFVAMNDVHHSTDIAARIAEIESR